MEQIFLFAFTVKSVIIGAVTNFEGGRAVGKIGVFGGSFNPIHRGHLAMATYAVCAFALERMLLLPTGNPPHKHEGLADKLDRMEMVRLAAREDPRFEACDLEITREGVIYTVDTLRALKRSLPEAELYYLIGADTLLDLHTWRRIEEVLSLCRFIVCGRPGYRQKEVISCMESMRQSGAGMYWLDMPAVDISATMVRAMAAEKRPLEGVVTAPVAAYIQSRGLYGA